MPKLLVFYVWLFQGLYLTMLLLVSLVLSGAQGHWTSFCILLGILVTTLVVTLLGLGDFDAL
jgi:hypothetical protein